MWLMTVLLMRHADREPSTSARDERELPLTSRGIRDVESVSHQLVIRLADYPLVNHVLVSPHRAAIETARQVLKALGVAPYRVIENRQVIDFAKRTNLRKL